ncbi:hypothetical protein EMCRGX_G028194 [Ephydatia muelleri]
MAAGGDGKEPKLENPFKLETISQLMKANFKDKKTKLNTDAVKLSAEVLYIFVLEGVYRSASQAQAEGAVEIDVQHFEKILPKLLLDF